MLSDVEIILDVLSYTIALVIIVVVVGLLSFGYTIGNGILDMFNRNRKSRRKKATRPTSPRPQAAGDTSPHPETSRSSASLLPASLIPDPCFLDQITLRCEICLELMYKVMAVGTCNHKFCASCILKWKCENNSCPKCRITIGIMTYDTLVQQIIDQYVAKYPDRARSEEERREADKTELKYLKEMMDTDGIGIAFDTEYETCRELRVHMRVVYLTNILRLHEELANEEETAPPPEAEEPPATTPPSPDAPPTIGRVDEDSTVEAIPSTNEAPRRPTPDSNVERRVQEERQL